MVLDTLRVLVWVVVCVVVADAEVDAPQPLGGSGGRERGNLVLNGGFEEWDAGQPKAWTVRPFHGRYVRSTKDDVSEGAQALCIDGAFTWLFVAQEIISVEPFGGKIVRVTARAKSADSATRISLDFGDNTVVHSSVHPGDGKWHDVTTEFVVPRGFEGNSFSLQLVVGGTPKNPSFFDEVTVYVEPLEEQGLGLANGGFERWIGQQPTYWVVRPGCERQISEVEGSESGADRAIGMAGGYTYCHVTQLVEWPEEISGKVVRVSAQVKCGEPGSAFIGVEHKDFMMVYSTKHPGDGLWHELSASYRVPAYSVYDAFGIVLIHGGNPTKPCSFDDINVVVQ